MCISGGVDSALGLFLISKHITENNLNPKITIATAVQPHLLPKWRNAKKIVSIISDMFPNVNIENHLITFLPKFNVDEYHASEEEQKEVNAILDMAAITHKPLTEEKSKDMKNYPKVLAFRTMHKNNWKNSDYDLGIGFVSSFPKLEELKKHKALYDSTLEIGPEDRSYTGKRNDLIQTDIDGGRRGDWWQPFLNKTKKDFADLYEEHNLMDSIFTYTSSCGGNNEENKYFPKPCQQCFFCLEKYWAFGEY